MTHQILETLRAQEPMLGYDWRLPCCCRSIDAGFNPQCVGIPLILGINAGAACFMALPPLVFR